MASKVDVTIEENSGNLSLNIKENIQESNVTVVDVSAANVNVSEIPAEVVVPDPIVITAPCDPVGVDNSDLTYSRIIQSGSTLVLPDITHTDSDLSPVTLPAQTAMVCTPVAVQSGIQYVRPIPTGQTTSYSLYDDYWQQVNNPPPAAPTNPTHTAQLVDFFTLLDNNSYGNKDRFSDDLGTQIYASNIMVDNYTGMSVYMTAVLNQAPAAGNVWDVVLADANASTQSGYSDWFIGNMNQVDSITNADDGLNYNPLNNTTNKFFFSSTTNRTNTLNTYSFYPINQNSNSPIGKSFGRDYFLFRWHF